MKSIPSAVRASPHGRVVLALFAVPAILIGLLAMHVLATGNMTETAIQHSSISVAATAGGDMTMAPGPENGRSR